MDHASGHDGIRRWLSAALTEPNQMMPSVLDGWGCDDPDFQRRLERAIVENQPYLLPDPALEPVIRNDLGVPDLLDDVRTVRTGLEVPVLDRTRRTSACPLWRWSCRACAAGQTPRPPPTRTSTRCRCSSDHAGNQAARRAD